MAIERQLSDYHDEHRATQLLNAGEVMRVRKELVRQAAYYGASLALAALVPALARALSRSLSPGMGVPRRDGRGVPRARDGKGILVAAAVGAAIGAGVALLLAPESRDPSGEWLAGRTRDLDHRVGVAIERGKDVVSNGVIPS